jgi:uncharacterized membrane protein YhaH (DUF805 family)
MPEKGLISFVKNKLNSGIYPKEIKRMLSKAGFDEKKIDDAILYIKQTSGGEYDSLLDVSYLPNLKSKKEEVKGSEEAVLTELPHLGLFNGRLRRKDFILGFIFFFGLGYVILSFSALIVSFISPALWKAILIAIQADTNGLLTITVPVLLTPITVMMISMITRRLHDLDLPGSLSFFFLAFFVPAYGASRYGLIALTVALVALFAALLSIKGHSKPNTFGVFPESRGSFFKRIFNQ